MKFYPALGLRARETWGLARLRLKSSFNYNSLAGNIAGDLALNIHKAGKGWWA